MLLVPFFNKQLGLLLLHILSMQVHL